MNKTDLASNQGKKALIKKLSSMIISCVLIAFSVSAVLKTNGLASSGVTGMALVLESVLHINYSIIYYALVIVVLIITLIFLGKEEVLKILAISIMYPTILVIMEIFNFEIVLDDKMLATVLFAVIYGTGTGLALKCGYSFGGTDTIAKIVQEKIFPFLSIGNILLVVDGIVIILAGISFGIEIALYAMIGQFIFTKVIDYIMFGLGTKVYKHVIISDKHEMICDYILSLGRGVTISNVVGAYTNKDRVEMSTVCSPKQSVLIRQFIAANDKHAFVEVIPIVAVWGKGKRFEKIDEKI